MKEENAPLLTTRQGVRAVQDALREMGLDGWLLFEFHGHNPIASALVGLERTTRRSFTLIPAEGSPAALIHAIEHSSWRSWPWKKIDYAGWKEMEGRLAELLGGRRALAIEVSPGSAVPTLDLVPAGVVELLRASGVEPVSSKELVTTFHAVWSPEQLGSHRVGAEVLASVAREAFERAAAAIREEGPLTEGELSRWILGELERRGVGIDHDCIVAIGPRAADPHYQPDEVGETIRRGELLLIDLWGARFEGDVYADQTWMGFMGSDPGGEAERIWSAVRNARDAGVDFLRERFAAGREVRGFEVDDVCRGVIARSGYGEYFVHRTGHSIDRELHGSGPNLDNLETRDDRLLVTGVGFSVEPGVYIPDRIGVRSEINVFWGSEGPEVTPNEPQREIGRFAC